MYIHITILFPLNIRYILLGKDRIDSEINRCSALQNIKTFEISTLKTNKKTKYTMSKNIMTAWS